MSHPSNVFEVYLIEDLTPSVMRLTRADVITLIENPHTLRVVITKKRGKPEQIEYTNINKAVRRVDRLNGEMYKVCIVGASDRNRQSVNRG